MPNKFDPIILDELRTAKEVRIRSRSHKGPGVIIWVVTVADAVFIRSVRGATAKWYVKASTDREATLQVGDRQLGVRLAPVSDPAAIQAVSEAFLSKYATSPYAKSIVAPDTLPTTLRVDPA